MKRRLLASAALALAASVLLAGCGRDEPSADAGALIIIVGVHEGVPAPNAEELQSTLESAVESGAAIALVALDGTPEISSKFDPLVGSELNNSVKKSDRIAEVIDAVGGLEADSDGDNLGEALNVAADQARVFGAAESLIIVLDSGLSDTGTPTMTTPGITTTDPQEVIDFIEADGRVPEFPAGTTVSLRGLGYGTDPQPPLTQAQRENVTAIWKGIAELGGATVEVVPEPRTGDGAETSFSTTPVEPETPAQFQVTPTDDGVQAVLTADDVQFAGCSSELPSTADAVLSQLLGLVQQAAGAVTITGHTATTSPCDPPYPDDQLSLDRAQAVLAWLVSNGVDPARLTAVGVADTQPLPGLSPDDPANRRVDVAINTV
jgi:flagellar motor protein MotB